MKHFMLLLILSIFSTFSLSAQNFNEEEVIKDVTTYFSYNESSQWEKLIDMLVPEFVNMMSRDMLITQMEQLVANPMFAISFSDMKVHKVHSNFSLEGGVYALVDHEFIMTFGMKQTEEQTDEEFETFFGVMQQTFEVQYGAESVTVDKESSAISVKPEKTILAVKREGYNSWKFIDYEPQNLMMYQSLFGEEVAEKLKSTMEPTDKE